MNKAVLATVLSLLIIGVTGLGFYDEPAKADLEAKLSLKTDKYVYTSGENITIILTNIGEATVWIGGYPAWTIFTHPEEEPVYPNIFATLLWSLNPGETDTFIWNQYNETGALVEPGMYVVKDGQGWRLSAYFEILEQPIPTEGSNPSGGRGGSTFLLLCKQHKRIFVEDWQGRPNHTKAYSFTHLQASMLTV